MPKDSAGRLQYVDDGIQERGEEFFRAVCDADLEGIVAKPKTGIYFTDGLQTNWLKIKNPEYSQMEGRHELFHLRGGSSRYPKPPHFVYPFISG
jgi:ATP-dependent DNA ligase